MLLPPPHPLLPGSKLHRQIHAPASLHALRTESAINPWKALLPPKPPLIEQTPHGAADTFIDFILKPHFILHLDPVDCNHRLSALSSWYNEEEWFKKKLDRHQTVRMHKKWILVQLDSRWHLKVISHTSRHLVEQDDISSITRNTWKVLSWKLASWIDCKSLADFPAVFFHICNFDICL